MSFFKTKENSAEPGSQLFGNRLSYGHEYNEKYHTTYLYLDMDPSKWQGLKVYPSLIG